MAETFDVSEAESAANRLRELMEWPGGNVHLFEVWRKTGKGEALAISVEKCNQLAEEIEYLREELKLRDRLIESFKIALKLFVPPSFISRRHYGKEEIARS